MQYTISVNGEVRSVEAEPDTPLLWVLREELGLTGTKYGCGAAQCGACTVHIDGMATRSCAVAVEDAEATRIVTIEGLQGPEIEALRAAWLDLEVPQCGYCQSGQLMTAAALLTALPAPNDNDIDVAMAGNVCRCCTYGRIRTAIHVAAGNLRS